MATPEIQPLSPAKDDAEAAWLVEAFSRNEIVGEWALPALFESYLEVRSFQPGSIYDQKSGATALSISQALVGVLRQFTATPDDCYFAVWAGYAGIPRHLAMTKFTLPPQREMLLLRGPIESVMSSVEVPATDRRPVRWWPTAREWCVGADIYRSTLMVGGTTACIRALAEDPEIAASLV